MNKKILIFGFLAFSFFTVLLTLYNLRLRTITTSHAQKSTTLAFVPATKPINGGDTVTMNMTITPGTNLVDYMQLVISYDSTKLQPGNPAIVPNPAIFPDATKNILQNATQGSCNGTTCTVSIILSIGFSPSAALQGTNPITIGHVTFTALQPTDSSGTQVSFDPATTIYSLATTDQLTENVLTTANPVSLVIGGSPIGTPAPTTMQQPTPTPTVGPGTPTPAGPPRGNIAVHFEAIDAKNNPTPAHPQRQLELDFYTTNNFANKPDFITNILVTHVAGDVNGNFINDSFDLSFIPQGSYYILVKSPEGSLREQVNPQLVQIGPGMNILPPLNPNTGNTPVAVQLRMGDVDNNNKIDVKDYNIIVDCFGRKQTSSACRQHKLTDAVKGLFADLDDDGNVDGVDYNIVVRHLGEVGY